MIRIKYGCITILQTFLPTLMLTLKAKRRCERRPIKSENPEHALGSGWRCVMVTSLRNETTDDKLNFSKTINTMTKGITIDINFIDKTIIKGEMYT